MANFDMRFEDGTNAYDSAVDEAMDDVVKRGLGVPSRPLENGELGDCPELPHLGEIGPSDLVVLLGVFTQWYSYAKGQEREAEIMKNAAEKKRAYAWSRVRKSKTGTVNDKDDQVRIDSRFINVDRDFEIADGRQRLIMGVVEGLKRDVETISRAITVWEQINFAEKRGGNAGKGNRPAPGAKAREAFGGRRSRR